MQQIVEEERQGRLTLAGSFRRLVRFARLLSETGSERKSKWPEWCALITYTSVVAIAVPFHESWMDEAQAWQLARSLSLRQLFGTYLRYEGSPGLWHFLLWLMNRLHIPYAGMCWLSAGLGVAATALLLFRSPLPRYLKLSLPFTFFLLYQYAVVGRNYALAPLLLYLAAIAWKKNPVALAVVLGLLANVSLHAAVISGGLAAVYAIELIRNRQQDDVQERRYLFIAVGLLVVFYAFAVWSAWPPADLDLSVMRGKDRNFWTSTIGSICWAVCEPSLLSLVFWGVIGLWFAARRKLLYLLPVLFFAIFSGAVYFNWWHAGLTIPLLISILWITWPGAWEGPFEFDWSARIALAVVIATHIAWSGYALVYDHFHAYSPDPAAARFLRPYVYHGDKIVVTYSKVNPTWGGKAFPAIGILPYFDHNIFANLPYPFWWWSRYDTSTAQFAVLLPAHPRIVIVDIADKHPYSPERLDTPEYRLLIKNDYRYRTSFCGSLPLMFQLGATVCHVIFEYSPSGDSSGRQAGNTVVLQAAGRPKNQTEDPLGR